MSMLFICAGYNDFDGKKSISRAIGRCGPWKSSLFLAQRINTFIIIFTRRIDKIWINTFIIIIFSRRIDKIYINNFIIIFRRMDKILINSFIIRLTRYGSTLLLKFLDGLTRSGSTRAHWSDWWWPTAGSCAWAAGPGGSPLGRGSRKACIYIVFKKNKEWK